MPQTTPALNAEVPSKRKCYQISDLIKSNALFAHLDQQQMEHMCKNSRLIKLDECEVLFHQGDRVYQFYFVIEGLIKLYRQSSLGQEKIFELEGPGKTFAEALMFLEEDSYPVNASAMAPSSLLAVNAQEYLKILRKSADSCMLVMGDLSRRLHHLINEVDQLSLHSGRNRVASYLLDMYRTQGDVFQLEIPKNAIASLLSLQPESLSRLLKELRGQSVIDMKENEVRILDEHRLRAFAGIA